MLANLEEYVEFWANMMPDTYSVIAITADEEIDGPLDHDGPAILAYSGGVDANFSLIANMTGTLGRRSRQIGLAALIQGLDISLEDQSLFDQSCAAAEACLSVYDVPLARFRTNWRDFEPDWKWAHGIGIHMVLCQMTQFHCILSGANETYHDLVVQWGSGAIVNPLFSAHDQRVEIVGSGITRCDRVAVVAKVPEIADRLRVCWKGPDQLRGRLNCGECEKCRRTRLNFAAGGLSAPASLDIEIDPAQIRRMRFGSENARAYGIETAMIARRNGIDAPWVRALEYAVWKEGWRAPISNRLKKVEKRIKRAVRRA